MKTIKVCLAWHSLTSSNYGVNALTIAHTQLIYNAAKNAGVNLDIFTIGTPQNQSLINRLKNSSSGAEQFRHYTVSAKILFKDFLKKGRIYEELKNTNFIFDIGEGDSYSDIYGFKRLSNLVSTKVFSHVLGLKQIIAPQTIGPFNNKAAKAIALKSLKSAHKLYTRDEQSLELLKSSKLNAKKISDVAFSLPFDKNVKKLSGAVGINVSGLLWTGGYNGENQFNLKINYKEFVKDLIDFFLFEKKTVHLISHVIDDNLLCEDDYRSCLQIKREYENNKAVIVGPKFNGAIEAKNYIAQMEFFVGSRMHATIAALSSGVPTIPVAYSRKFAGVFNGISYPHVIDAKICSTEEALSIIKNDYLNSYDQLLKETISAIKIAKYSNHIYEQDLTEMFINEKTK